jgi:hypothetical protein
MLRHEPGARAQNRRLLEDAGYSFDGEAWVHPQTGRSLDGTVAEMLSPLRVWQWIDDGE